MKKFKKPKFPRVPDDPDQGGITGNRISFLPNEDNGTIPFFKKKEFMNVSESHILLMRLSVKESIKDCEMLLANIVKSPESPEKTKEIEKIRASWIADQRVKETYSFILKTGNFDTPFTQWDDHYFKDKFERKIEQLKKLK